MDRPASTTVTIAVISDFHVSEPGHPDAQVRLRRLKSAIEAVRASKPDLVLAPGDLTEDGTPYELAMCMECLREIEQPVRVVPGNHDVGDKRIGERCGVTSARVAAYRGAVGADVYAERVAGIHLIGLNGPLLGSGLPEEESMWQLLEDALEDRGSEPRVVMLHYPPFVTDADEPGGDYWGLEVEPRRRLLDTAAAGRVDMILSGHLHRPLWAKYGPMTLATSPSVAFGLPFDRQPTGWMEVTIAPDGQVSRTLHYSTDEATAWSSGLE